MTDSSRPVALVTGASGGIARAIVRRLTATGWSVAKADRSVDAGSTPDDSLETSVHHLDVRETASCDDVVAAALARWGRLDALVNAAGVMVRHDALHTTDEEWDEIMAINLRGAFRMARAAHPALATSKGAIVSISSTHATLAAKNSIAYSTSKAGLSHLTRLLALEWADDGIRVNAVAPTVVSTAMTRDVLADPSYIARKMAAIPLGRPVAADQVAGAVRYLLSEDAASTTGQILILDGGESLA